MATKKTKAEVQKSCDKCKYIYFDEWNDITQCKILELEDFLKIDNKLGCDKFEEITGIKEEPPNFREPRSIKPENFNDCIYRYRSWYCNKYKCPCNACDRCDSLEEDI